MYAEINIMSDKISFITVDLIIKIKNLHWILQGL